jgi:phosphatidylserine decarboxylase
MSLPEPLFAALQQVIPQHMLSRIIGKLAECEFAPLKNKIITAFVDYYGVNLSEALISNAESFKHFNDFFTRELKPGARTITDNPNAISCPADGAISEIGDIEVGSLLQAKGQRYSLMSLLADSTELAESMMGGKFATIYLSPKDYHRVHMPCGGTLVSTTYVPGKLFSVNQATANQIPGLFARNERLICHFDSEQGPFIVILVGAMIVAGIETVWAGEVAPVRARLKTTSYQKLTKVNLAKGDEMGRFKLGSTAILLFPKGRIEWNADLRNGSATRMGEAIGTLI